MTTKVPSEVAALLIRAGFALIHQEPMRAANLARLMVAGLEMLDTDDPRDRRDVEVLAAGLAAIADEIAPPARALADEALDAACRTVQQRLGVTTGDLAAQFFPGGAGDPVFERLLEYAALESSLAAERERASDTKEPHA